MVLCWLLCANYFLFVEGTHLSPMSLHSEWRYFVGAWRKYQPFLDHLLSLRIGGIWVIFLLSFCKVFQREKFVHLSAVRFSENEFVQFPFSSIRLLIFGDSKINLVFLVGFLVACQFRLSFFLFLPDSSLPSGAKSGGFLGVFLIWCWSKPFVALIK